MLYFIFEEIIIITIIIIGIIANLLNKTLRVSIACYICLIVAIIEKAIEIGIASTIEVVVGSQAIFIVNR